MFREFVYLDIDRVQSIIAQLQEGLLTEVMSGNQKELAGKLGFLSHLLPVSPSLGAKAGTSIEQNKVLHDYSFNVALDSLREKDLLLEETSFDRGDFPVPETAFVLVEGTAKILDYATLSHIADNEHKIDEIFGDSDQQAEAEEGLNRQQRRQQQRQKNRTVKAAPSKPSAFGGIKGLLEVFFENEILISVTNAESIDFVGILNREHLREDIKKLIFKYGAKPQGNWTMLAQVSRLPTPDSAPEQGMEDALSALNNDFFDEVGTVSNLFNVLIELMNAFQEKISSVTYPDVSVSPIAIYRETYPLR